MLVSSFLVLAALPLTLPNHGLDHGSGPALAHAGLASSSLTFAAAPEAVTAAGAEEDEDQAKDDKGPRRTRGLVLRAFGKAGTAGLPGVGVGGGLSVGYLRNRFRLDLMGSGRLNRSTWYPSQDIGGDFSLWRAGLRACAVFGSGKISTPLCGGADSGMVTASGVGIDSARTERQPWASVFADIDLAWHVLPQVALVATSRMLVPLVRRQYYVGQRGTLVTTPPFGVEIGLGLELVLP